MASSKKQQRAQAKSRALPTSSRRQQARPQRQPRNNGGKTSLHSLLPGLDAAMPRHLPGPRSSAKYVVHRTKTDISLDTTTADTVLVFGDFLKSSSYQGGENRISPTLGVYGSGANVPKTTETLVSDPLLLGASSDAYSVSLHNLTVEVRCTGTSAGLIPPGLFYLGVPSVGFDRSAYGAWSSIASTFKTKTGMSRFTAYEGLQKARRAISYPLDPVKFSEFRYNHGSSESTDQFGGALAPIMIILDANATTQTSWTITVHAEWRMRSNVDPIVQSMQKSHAPVAEDTWHRLSSILSSAGGVIDRGLQLSQTVGSVVEHFRTSPAGRMSQLALEVD